MTSKHFLFFTTIIAIINVQYAVAQTKPEKEFKNTIKYNFSTAAIFGFRTYIIGYERVINKHQTLCVNIGRNFFPSLHISPTDSLNVGRSFGDKGLHLSVEYRFYLKGENKFDAPHGVFIGPYYSYNYFERENTWNIKSAGFNGAVNTDLSLHVNTVGVEFGYQFIFWKRLTLDMILIGPGIAAYKLKASINTNLSSEENELLFQKINDALSNKIPGYSLVLAEGDFKKSGTVNTNSFNFRYQVQLGFRF